MNEQIKDIKSSCLNKWGNGASSLDERLQTFDENFEKWFAQIPEQNRSTVITLIEHLEYYSHKKTNFWLKTLHSKLVENSSITIENTIYVFLKSKDGKTNSSNDYWTEYKAINRLNKNTCIENMDVLEPEDWDYIENIVFIDDFSGSGDSFIGELKKNPDRYRGKNIYFITINTMITAVEKINTYCSENNLSVVLLSAYNQAKAFEGDIFDNNETAKDEIYRMSREFRIPKNDCLGFKGTQALAVFYNNTPNNTLGFIRYTTPIYSAIFPRRDDDVPTWMKMKKERRRRNAANYNNKVEGVKDE